jgi:hypothetical protein
MDQQWFRDLSKIWPRKSDLDNLASTTFLKGLAAKGHLERRC